MGRVRVMAGEPCPASAPGAHPVTGRTRAGSLVPTPNPRARGRNTVPLTPQEAAQLAALESKRDAAACEDGAQVAAEVGAATVAAVAETAHVVAEVVADAERQAAARVEDVRAEQAGELARDAHQAEERLAEAEAAADLAVAVAADVIAEHADAAAVVADDAVVVETDGADVVVVDQGAEVVEVDESPATPARAQHPYFRPLKRPRLLGGNR